MKPPICKINDFVEFKHEDMITGTTVTLKGVVDYIEPECDEEEGYEYTIYIPSVDDYICIYEKDIVRVFQKGGTNAD